MWASRYLISWTAEMTSYLFLASVFVECLVGPGLIWEAIIQCHMFTVNGFMGASQSLLSNVWICIVKWNIITTCISSLIRFICHIHLY